MKKTLIISIALNAIFVLFFAGKRYYYSYGPGAGHDKVESVASLHDQWNKMRSSVLEALPIDTCDIVFAGNSLTEAFPVTEIFGKCVKNRGIGGNSTIHLLNRMPAIAQKRPKKIFLEIGINDLIAGDNVARIFGNYQGIINTTRTVSPHTEIYVQSLMPTCKSYGYLMGSIDSLNNDLAIYCKKHRIGFIDLYTPLLKGSGLDSGYTADGLHLNGKGYAIWRKAVEKYVNVSNDNQPLTAVTKSVIRP